MHVRKEAVLSSQIEGTQSTLGDLLRFENAAIAGQPIDDVSEVSNSDLHNLRHYPRHRISFSPFSGTHWIASSSWNWSALERPPNEIPVSRSICASEH